MKSWFLGVLMAAVAVSFVPSMADAKRIGGGSSKGMQRSTPAAPAQNTPPSPAQPATPANPAGAAPAAAGATAAAGAAAAGKRSWMGPLAGLAAGLGLAALFSHLGLGDELASFVLIALAVAAAFFLFRFFMRRSAGVGAAPRLAAAGAPGGVAGGIARQMPAAEPASAPLQRTAAPVQAEPSSAGAAPAAFTGLKIGSNLDGAQATAAAAAPLAAAPVLPEGFDRAGFERLARLIFIRMQAANDAADINDLRNFTTPELFAELRLDLQERGPAAQHTDVLEVQASVVDFAQETDRQVVSVRYQGRVQEAEGVPAEAFDEIWHLVKPLDDSRNWAIAGIQQAQ